MGASALMEALIIGSPSEGITPFTIVLWFFDEIS